MPQQFLSTVPEPDRSRLLEVCRERDFDPGDVVVHEGEQGDSLFLVESGRLLVRSSTEDGDSVTLDLIGPGGTVGVIGLVRPSHRRTATVTALDTCRTRVLKATVYAQLVDRHPSVERALTLLLADDVERLTQQVLEAHFVPVEQRIARRLLRVAEMSGHVEPGTELPLTQQDVADLAGAARPTTNQALKRLEAAGAIGLARGRVIIANPTLLDERTAVSH